MTDNKLQLNEDKFELVIISPTRQANKLTLTPSKLVSAFVKAAFTMTQSKHFTKLLKSCNFHLRSIGQARRFLTHDASTKIIHAFISSWLDCCNQVTRSYMVFQTTKLLNVSVLNTAARIVTNTRKFDHISPVLESLHWLPVGK